MIYTGTLNGFAPSLTDLGTTVDNTCARLRGRLRDFDSIVVTGVSGVVVGAPVALVLDKNLVIVRKPTDSHHAGCGGPADEIVNLVNVGRRWLFLDDFISTGTTLQHVRKALHKAAPHAEFAGAFLYSVDAFADKNGMYEL